MSHEHGGHGPHGHDEREPGEEGGGRRRESGFGRARSRILHARISEELHEALRRASAEFRMPVSNLVRNALEDMFTAVHTMTDNVHTFVERVVSEAEDVGDRIREHRARAQGEDGASASETAEEGNEDRARSRRERWREAARSARRAARSPAEGPAETGADAAQGGGDERFARVAAWQPVFLNSAQSCASCEAPLAAGERAYLGVAAVGAGEAVWVCAGCLSQRRRARHRRH